ncbi:hypothetical protein PV646_28845 [Streptomyces sp. ID05-26A]|nr:hypothetical protein [Streptomyces sp. ID05-26A]
MTSGLTSSAAPAPVSPSWSLLVAESVTGKRVASLPLTGMRWSHGLRFGTGTELEVTVPLDGPPLPGRQTITERVRMVCDDGPRFMLVTVYGRTPVSYGFVTAPSPSPGACTIGTLDLAGLLRRRSIIAHGQRATPTRQAADVALGPASKPTLARQLMLHAIGEAGGALPLVISTPSLSGSHVRTYNGFRFENYATALGNLVDDEDGPDIRVTPQLSADQQWVTLKVDIGEPYIGTSSHHWECPGAALDVVPDYDHSGAGAWHYAPGDGTDYDRPVGVGYAGSMLAAGVPLMDQVDSSRGGTNDQATLNSAAAANARVFERGLESLTLTVDAAGKPQLGTYAAGDAATVRTSQHWWLGSGLYRRRIVGIAGDHTDKVTVTTAPTTQGT